MSEKKYNCIYCQFRATKTDLVNHIDKTHMDEIPEGFTALQVVYHIVNKHPLNWKKPCRVCKKPTNWDEKKGRYNLLCENKTCHDAWAEKMKKDMGDKMGSNRPTSSAEGLQKMLAGRKISGKYKFKDGKEFTYTGSYELETLKFMDQVMDIKSEDILCPGPVLEYTLDEKKHLYITDIFYIPYNLIIEVKDGGNNPNTNPEMYENRRKKIAKEKYVIEETDYNYIRLTNKDFSQLLAVFADLKMNLVDNSNDRVIHINESAVNENMYPAIQGAIPPNSANGVYIINYMRKGSFNDDTNIMVSDSPKFDRLFAIADDTLKELDKSSLTETVYNTYLYKNNRKRVLDFCTENINKPMTEAEFYKGIFGHERLLEGQIEYENDCSRCRDFYDILKEENEAISKFIREGEINNDI